MFLTDSDIQARLAAVLKVDQADLDPYWVGVLIPDCHLNAYNEIVTRLSARGFSMSAITSWDRGKEFESAISLYWLLVQGAGLHDYSDQAVKALDRRGELDKILLTTGGAEIVPDITNEGKTIGSGTLNENLRGLQFRYGAGPGQATFSTGPGAWQPWPRQIW